MVNIKKEIMASGNSSSSSEEEKKKLKSFKINHKSTFRVVEMSMRQKQKRKQHQE